MGQRADDCTDTMLLAADEAHRGRPIGVEGVHCLHWPTGAHGRLRFVFTLVSGSLVAVHVQHNRGHRALQVCPFFLAGSALPVDDLAAPAAGHLQPGLGDSPKRALVAVLALLRCAGCWPRAPVSQSRSLGLDRAGVPVLLAAADRERCVAGLQECVEPNLLRGHVLDTAAVCALPLGLPRGHLQRRAVPAAARLDEPFPLLLDGSHAGLPAGGHGPTAEVGTAMVRALGLHALGIQLPQQPKRGPGNRLRDLHGRNRRGGGAEMPGHALQPQVPSGLPGTVDGCEDGMPHM
mmetsp:Transcript_76031/g.217787  ORF Transcript_76031/g.217787 Transcript_76031/m.217787 type:complete len:292 (-) Transcript_76031:15-890(-)